MATRRKQRQTSTKTKRKQRGGLQCGNDKALAVFKYNDNSCYFDTLLIGLLHIPPTINSEMRKNNSISNDLYSTLLIKWAQFKEKINEYESAAHKGSVPSKEKVERYKERMMRVNFILPHLFSLYEGLQDALHNNISSAIRNATSHRNELRNTLDTCEAFTKGLQVGHKSLRGIQEVKEIFNLLIKYLNINTFVQYEHTYKVFEGWTEDDIEKFILARKITDPAEKAESKRLFIKDKSLNYQRKEYLEGKKFEDRDSELILEDSIDLKLVDDERNLLEKIQIFKTDITKYEMQGDYITRKEVFGTTYGILPVNIERRYLSLKTLKQVTDYSSVDFKEFLELPDGKYCIYSIICHFGIHYTAFYRCTDDTHGTRRSDNVIRKDRWMFYNDIVIDPKEPKGGLLQVGPFNDLIKKPVPGNEHTPRELAAFLFYMRLPGAA
jgi:hypothetical protein